jgi:hypothetical protein
MRFFNPEPPKRPEITVMESLESTKTGHLPIRLQVYYAKCRWYDWHVRLLGVVVFAAICMLLLGVMTFISWFRP